MICHHHSHFLQGFIFGASSFSFVIEWCTSMSHNTCWFSLKPPTRPAIGLEIIRRDIAALKDTYFGFDVLLRYSLIHSAALYSAYPPISPTITIPLVHRGKRNTSNQYLLNRFNCRVKMIHVGPQSKKEHLELESPQFVHPQSKNDDIESISPQSIHP